MNADRKRARWAETLGALWLRVQRIRAKGDEALKVQQAQAYCFYRMSLASLPVCSKVQGAKI